MTKMYNRTYFNAWYRGRGRIHGAGEIRKKVALAVAVTEYFVRRPLRTVLDIGCGEGAWYSHLRVLRPRATYAGIDPSDYVVEAFGEWRNIRKGSFGTLRKLRLREPFDLVVCADVLHYLDDDEIRRGLPELVRLTGGVAFLDVLTRDDDIIGDLEEIKRRPPRWYRRRFSAAGLTAVAPYCWLSPALRGDAAELEIPE